MGLHLVVDQAPYISTMDDHPLNPECNKSECYKNAYSLRRLSDGALVRPEVVLVGDNGVEVTIRPEGHLYPSFDKHVMTVALSTFKDVNSPSPPFPEGVRSFISMRIRSTAPFLVRYLWWSVDHHPEQIILGYKDFGPPALASKLIGDDYWQWNNHGDSRPRDYHVLVVVYRNVDLITIKEQYPVIKEKEQDYRYVEYQSAMTFLNTSIKELESFKDEISKTLIGTLTKTRSKIESELKG